MPTLVRRRAPGSPALTPSLVRRMADAMLVELELTHAELSVLLCNDAEIHALNLEHRNKDKPTDVLSFPLDEGGGADGTISGQRVLGDVVISLDTADRQARARKRPLPFEVRFLLAHGLLHLIGYDHANRAEKREMDAMSRRLVRAVVQQSTKAGKSTRRAASPARPSGPARRPKGRRAETRARARLAK